MESKRQIIVSYDDHERLANLLTSKFASVFSDKPYLQELRREISLAEIVSAADIPPNVVTMNSTVRLYDLLDQEEETYTLVYPDEANIAEGKLSVFAPIGTAIIGTQVGDMIRWNIPHGLLQLKVTELIFQPERDGIMA